MFEPQCSSVDSFTHIHLHMGKIGTLLTLDSQNSFLFPLAQQDKTSCKTALLDLAEILSEM